MKKLKIFLSIVLALLSITNFSNAHEGLIISEIIISGNTRTQDQLILRQLPFKEGDLWQDSFTRLTILRLQTIDMLAYEPMRVIVSPLNEQECLVLIRVSEASVLYKDAAEFFFSTATELLFRSFNQTLHNPLGTGQNLYLNLAWGPNYAYGGGISAPLAAGNILINGRYFYSDRTFFDDNYQHQGYLIRGNYRYWWDSSLRSDLRVTYHDYQLSGDDYSFVLPGLTLFFQNQSRANFSVQTGLSLNDQESFWQVQSNLYNNWGNIHSVLRGGYTSLETPADYRFAVGGFSALPLRGESALYICDGYGLSNLEYHHQLNDLLKIIIFKDMGYLWQHDPVVNHEGFLLNLGAGFAFYTPLGFPLRLDLGVNPLTKNWAFNFGMGHSFNPPF